MEPSRPSEQSRDSSAKQTSPNDWIELLGKVAGLVSGAALMFSVFYDYSFLLGLGIRFDEVPTSLTDHLRSAVVWFPPLIVGAAFYLLIELQMRLIEGFRTEEEIVTAASRPVATSRFRRSHLWFARICAVALVIYLFLFGTSAIKYYVAFFFAWPLIVTKAVLHARNRERFSRAGGIACVAVPMVAAVVGGSGYLHATKLLDSNKPVWYLTLKKGEADERLDVSGVRRFGATVVAVTTAGSVAVVPEASVLMAQRALTTTKSEHLICSVTGLLCPNRVLLGPTK